jgi:hypothetical protein
MCIGRIGGMFQGIAGSWFSRISKSKRDEDHFHGT